VTDDAAPVSATDRVQLMDVLRGVALFGVFLVNFMAFASASIMATELQLLSLPNAPLDLTLFDVLGWLFTDKANTLFAFLFGLGFAMQLQRLERRGVDFEALYRRRLTVLLVIGVIHFFFVWTWDILHLYALAGFLLLPLRRLSNRGLVIAGVLLATFGRTTQKALAEFGSPGSWSGVPGGYADSDVLLRQQISESGDYFRLVNNFFEWVFIDYLASGFILGWLCYALGRFLIGAWVGRREWVTRATDFLPGWRRLLRIALPAGLVLEGFATMLAKSSWLPEWEHRDFLADAVHLLAVPVLSAGYLAGIVVAFQGGLGRRLLAPFAAVGRMALTNYLSQSLVIGFVLFGIGPGLALAGKIGTTSIVGIVLGFFAVQVLVSRWWLVRYEYGPMEWVWRAFTYGERPAMKREVEK
jgi:uncharacterized protein